MSLSDIHYSTVHRDVVELLLEQHPQASAVELANLWGDIGFWSGQKKRRWSKSAYHLTYGTNPRTLARYLNELEQLGAVTTDPVNRKALLPPWAVHQSCEGDDKGDGNLSPLSLSISNSISQSISISNPAAKKTGNREQINELIEAWNQNKPDTWKALKKWNPARQKCVEALSQGNGGITQFVADIPLVMAGLKFIGKKDNSSCSYWLNPENKQHHTFDCFLGVDQKQPKSNWTKALEAAPETCATSDSFDTLKPEQIWSEHHPSVISANIPMGLTPRGDDLRRQEKWSEETYKQKHAEAWQTLYGVPFSE